MKNHEIEWISKYLNIPVEITTNLSLISENEYDQELAKCHIANYGEYNGWASPSNTEK